MKADKILIFLLRFEAAVLFLAIPAIFLPTSWMSTVHELLGLGTFPDSTLVQYLTRSISVLYAGWAPLLLYVSLDVHHHVTLIKLLSWIRIVFGVALTFIDLQVGMPWFWIVGEGPMIALASLLQLWLAHRLQQV